MKREGPGGTPDSDDGTPTQSNRLLTDGGLDAPDAEERERRARQRGIGFIVRCRRANLDPHDTLDDVLEQLDDVGGDDERGKAVLPDGGSVPCDFRDCTEPATHAVTLPGLDDRRHVCGEHVIHYETIPPAKRDKGGPSTDTAKHYGGGSA